MEKTAYDYYLESEDKDKFITDKSIEWGLSIDELLVILNNTNKTAREKKYPKIVDQLDIMWHEINTTGTLSDTGNWFNTIKEIKDNHPKPIQ